jgi:hypothetical protein
MFEFPSAAIVSNRCWSVMMNKMSGRVFGIVEMKMCGGLRR